MQQAYEDFLAEIKITLGSDEKNFQDISVANGEATPRAYFNDHIGHGYWEVDRLDECLVACIANVSYCENLALSYKVLQEHYVLRFVVSGNIQTGTRGTNAYQVPSEKISIHHVHKGEVIAVTYPKGSVLSCLTIYISKEYIQALGRLLPKESQYYFQVILNQVFGLKGKEITLKPHERNLISQLQELRTSGDLRRHMIKSKVGELLYSLLTNYIQWPKNFSDHSAAIRQIKKFQLVFDLLEQNYISPPTTQEISRKIGLNQTMLRRGFRATYGKSISEHCLEKRMYKACDLLCSNNRNITQIAEELGYNHSTNFTASFKRYFGVLPKDYRNDPGICSGQRGQIFRTAPREPS